jgi:hypothetical protein
VRHANVFTDTSGIRRFDLLEQAVQRAGAKKVLFGSDGPWLHPGLELAKVRALQLPKADEDLITGGNLVRLLRRVRRQRRQSQSATIPDAPTSPPRWGDGSNRNSDPWVLDEVPGL